MHSFATLDAIQFNLELYIKCQLKIRGEFENSFIFVEDVKQKSDQKHLASENTYRRSVGDLMSHFHSKLHNNTDQWWSFNFLLVICNTGYGTVTQVMNRKKQQ